MDNLVFEESINAEIDQSEFISKKWIYVNDSNSQNYTSQVVIDSTSLANSGGWINWQEGYIVMPLVVELQSGVAGSLPANTNIADHAWAFKAGFWHMINSMTLEFNNQNVVQQTPFLNVFRSFKAHTSFSLDDLLNEGYTIGYSPDTAGSWSFAPTSVNTNQLSANGQGLCNNKAAPITSARIPVAAAALTTNSPIFVATASAGLPVGGISGAGSSNPSGLYGGAYGCNKGFADRQEWYTYDPITQTAGNGLGQALINDAATSNTVYRAYRIPYGTNGKIGWSVMAKLRLKDLSDFFLKAPLLKGSTIRFYINTNQTSLSFTTVAGTVNADGTPLAYPLLTSPQVSVLGGLTNPLMVASAAMGQGCSTLPADTYTLSVNIFKSADGIFQTALQSCRLYAPVYKMNPLAEQRYLQLAPTKKVDYNDIFQYQFSNIGPSESFNILVSNGISDIQSVLVVPFLTAAANGTAFNTLLSPFSTSGATPDPITLTNFNILVSGINLFLNNEYYDFEQFNQELKSSNQLNGSLTTGLASGLVSEDMFSRGYRYYYGNCSRVLPSEVGVSRSIQIQGINQSLVACNLMVFVEFKRSLTIDISTGARIE
ncbi:MAG: hypothetical protein ACRCZ2_07520 [Fusobacteriaceae bacterium]